MIETLVAIWALKLSNMWHGWDTALEVPWVWTLMWLKGNWTVSICPSPLLVVKPSSLSQVEHNQSIQQTQVGVKNSAIRTTHPLLYYFCRTFRIWSLPTSSSLPVTILILVLQLHRLQVVEAQNRICFSDVFLSKRDWRRERCQRFFCIDKNPPLLLSPKYQRTV